MTDLEEALRLDPVDNPAGYQPNKWLNEHQVSYL